MADAGRKDFLPDLISAGEIELELLDVDEYDEIKAQDLAEDLLEKLIEIWSEYNYKNSDYRLIINSVT